MEKAKASLIWSLMILLLGIALAGCAAVRKEKALDQERNAINTERALSDAGFRMRLADTEKKLAHLETLIQRRLVPHRKDGALYYVYADAIYCQCVYVGTEKAYDRYQGLAARRIAHERLVTEEMTRGSGMDWDMMGHWGPRELWH